MLEIQTAQRRETAMTEDVYPRILVDFNWLGQAERFRVPLRLSIREQLRVGDEVVIYGDGVADLPARVLAVSPDVLEVEFQLIAA